MCQIKSEPLQLIVGCAMRTLPMHCDEIPVRAAHPTVSATSM